MTQAAAIVEYLERHKTLTRAECMTKLGIMEVTPRISYLESLGFLFSREKISHVNQQGKAVRICRYSIAQYPKEWKRMK